MFDKSKLSRDYEKDPLSSTEDIIESDLRYLYCESGLTKTDICKYLHCCTTKLYRLVKKYNITKKVTEINTMYLNKIDWSRLRRNYIEQPLKYQERPTKEEVEYLYIELELPRDVISRVFGRGNSERFAAKLITEYKINLPKEIIVKHRRDSYFKKTGYRSPLSNPLIRKKVKQTCLAKYGVSSWMQTDEAKKAQGTLLNTKEQISKAKITREQTNLQKYGVKNPLMLDEYKQKQHETFLKKYNADNYTQSLLSQETRDILQDPGAISQLYIDYPEYNTQKIAELLDVSQSCLLEYIHKYSLESLINTTTSSFEREIRCLFPTINFVKDRTILDGKEIDLYSPTYKIGIEFNGNYWHSDAQKTPTYHRDKSALAVSKGVFIFHIFEYEWSNAKRKKAIINRLSNLFGLNKVSIFARKCEIREVEQQLTSKFLDDNHVQGEACATIRIGLFYNGELVSLMTFSTNKINKDHQYELTRFCSKAGTNVVGGASKLFNYFIKTYNPESIVSYSDDAKSNGSLYKRLGFIHINTTYPQYHWTDGNTTLTRYQTQRKKLIKLRWLKDGETKSESAVMREHGFFKIYDCGKHVWSWINPQQLA